MWDDPMRIHYMRDSETKRVPEAYFSFLKKMQEMAKYLRERREDIFTNLFSNINEPLENHLKNFISNKKENMQMQHIMKFIGNKYKNDLYIDAKFLDEYNWTVYTKKILVPPAWYPSDYRA